MLTPTLCHNKVVPKRFLRFLFILVLLIVVGSVYFVFRPQISNWIDSLVVKGDGEDLTEEPACMGETYTNQRQGYKACYLVGWYTQEFGYSQLSVGFDPFPIPEASEYPGMLSVSVSHKNSPTLLAEYLGDFEEPATAAVTVGGVTGIKVSGTLSSDHAFFPDYFRIVTVLENLSRRYTIQLLSSPDDYETNVTKYEEFMEGLRFLKSAPTVPWGKDIYLSSPWSEDRVSGTFRIVGSAKGAFENTLVARLKNANGEVILETPIIYDSPGDGGLGYFDVSVTFSTATSSGLLEVFYTSAKDGSIVDLVSVPLKFK